MALFTASTSSDGVIAGWTAINAGFNLGRDSANYDGNYFTTLNGTTAINWLNTRSIYQTPTLRENHVVSATAIFQNTSDGLNLIVNSTSNSSSYNQFRVDGNGNWEWDYEGGFVSAGSGLTVPLNTPFTMSVDATTSTGAVLMFNGSVISTVGTNNLRTGLYCGIELDGSAGASVIRVGAQLSYVQSTKGVNTNNTTAVGSFSALPTVGNTIIVCAGGDGNFATGALSISDNQGGANTYTAVNPGIMPAGSTGAIYMCTVAASTGTFTITVTNASNIANSPKTVFGAVEFTNIGALDKITTPQTGGNIVATGNLSGSSAGGSLEVVFIWENSTAIPTVDSFSPPYITPQSDVTLSAAFNYSFRRLSVSTNVGATWTETGGPATTWCAGATFTLFGAVTGSAAQNRRRLYTPGSIASRNRRGW